MYWPANFLDGNLFKHSWDGLRRRLAAQSHTPPWDTELQIALREERQNFSK